MSASISHELNQPLAAIRSYTENAVVLLDHELNFVKAIETGSRVSAVYDAAPRKSFVVALKDLPELWEVSYDAQAEDVPSGLVHDYRSREGAFVPGFLNARRTRLDDVLDDFFFTPDYRQVVGASRDGKRGQVVHLDVRRAIASVELPGLPLGAFQNVPYDQIVLELSAGDIYVFFTDGVSETFNAADEEFGTERLEEIVHARRAQPAAAIVQAIVDAVEGFRGELPQGDDLTVVVVKITG